MKSSIENQLKDIESRKRLQELAGIKPISNREDLEKEWEDLQKEMENILNQVKSSKKK
jgi:hypothetical protein